MSEVKTKLKLKIKDLVLGSNVILAPMAGVTDTVLRRLVRQFSEDSLVYSEMLSSEALRYNPKASIIHSVVAEKPIAYQLSGHKPDVMAEGASVLNSIADIIDINMGCPAPKIVSNGDGSALMKNMDLAYEIISAVRKVTDKPLTVKHRLGWDVPSQNCIEFAKMAESAGADAVIVHGRTKSQMYTGVADWEAIAEIKQNINIPVIANGDIVCASSAKECLDITKCDGIAIGRGIMGNPMLIHQIETYLKTGKILEEPSLEQKLELAYKHCEMEAEFRSEVFGIKFMRKFFAHYVKGIPGACQFRHSLVQVNTLEDVRNLFEEIKQNV